jgi:hypothetical protein
MPIELPIHAPYADPTYQEQLKREIEARVLEYKEHPALWMWGLGNEVLFGIESLQEAEDFARFYVELADFVRGLDPNHPVFYRDAEDAFVGLIRDAFQSDGRERTWFVYGINIFTTRIESVLADWPEHEFDVALVVSEFGPMAYPPSQRPSGHRWMWQVIRSRSEYVLGGFVYVWFRNGPDPLDPMFGLVDANGQPVDGTLATITELYSATP